MSNNQTTTLYETRLRELPIPIKFLLTDLTTKSHFSAIAAALPGFYLLADAGGETSHDILLIFCQATIEVIWLATPTMLKIVRGSGDT